MASKYMEKSCSVSSIWIAANETTLTLRVTLIRWLMIREQIWAGTVPQWLFAQGKTNLKSMWRKRNMNP